MKEDEVACPGPLSTLSQDRACNEEEQCCQEDDLEQPSRPPGKGILESACISRV